MQTIWNIGSDAIPACVTPSLLHPDQSGVQGLQQTFVPGQWVVRYALLPANASEIAQLEYLAKAGLLERKPTYLNLGPIRGRPAVEYRPTWAGSAYAIGESLPNPFPCFYYGISSFMRVLDYTESSKNADGFSRVTIRFLRSVRDVPEWAKAAEAVELFPPLREIASGRESTLTLYRGEDGRLRTSPEAKQPIEFAETKAPNELPGVNAAMEGVTRLLSAKDDKARRGAPKPCFRMQTTSMEPVWKEGDSNGSEVVLQFPKGKSETWAMTYVRLERLRRAGLVELAGDPNRAPNLVSVRPTKAIRALMSANGACLPLGETRVEVLSVQRDRTSGVRQQFKARYVVVHPAPWISSIRDKRFLPDLLSVLEFGQPFEGTTVKLPEGWSAAYFIDRRPQFTFNSLTAVGPAPEWPSVTDDALALSSVVNHELHLLDTYKASRRLAPSESRYLATGRVDVVVRKTASPILLVLTAYEPTEWAFKVEPGARVDAVMAIGYHEQSFRGLGKRTRVLSAYVRDGSNRFDPSPTYARGGGNHLAWLGVQPASAQDAGGPDPVVIGGKR